MSKGKKKPKKNPVKITFDEKDREIFLKKQGKKHSKNERKKYQNELKLKKKDLKNLNKINF